MILDESEGLDQAEAASETAALPREEETRARKQAEAEALARKQAEAAARVRDEALARAEVRIRELERRISG